MNSEKNQFNLSKALEYIQKKNYEKAIESLLNIKSSKEEKYIEKFKFLGFCHSELKNKEKALFYYQKYNFLKPGDHEALVKLAEIANTPEDAAKYAFAAYTSTESVHSLLQSYHYLYKNNHHQEAWDCLLKILEHCKDDDYRSFTTIHSTAIRYCEWEIAKNISQIIDKNIYQKSLWHQISITPLDNLSQYTDQSINLKLAQAFCNYSFTNHKKINIKNKKSGDKFRIGYVSSDFFNHATLHLMVGVFEHHDFQNFDFFAYDHSPIDDSTYRKRFVDTGIRIKSIHHLSDQEAAELIRSDNIDLLIDLKGITGSSRLGIFKIKPAPVQATYLGYPGSVGMEEIDYVISDPIVTPLEYAAFYTEKLCLLPETYQCNDFKRKISNTPLKRSDFGLPEDAVVYCSFNQYHKINQETFEAWLTILNNVPNSVLWLMEQNPIGKKNLLDHAQRCGIASERIHFTKGLYPSLHLRRVQLADIALDTFIYNGHTTTADALWVGVPVITKKGVHFASRVASSLLTAVGMPELIAENTEEFIKIGIVLGNDKALLSEIKENLRKKIFSHPLFDTERFTRHLEKSFIAMIRDQGKNHIHVEKLPDRLDSFKQEHDLDPTVFDMEATLKIAPVSPIDKNNFPLDHCPACESHKRKTQVFIHQHFGPEKLKRLETHYAICETCGHRYAKNHLSDQILRDEILSKDVDMENFLSNYFHIASNIKTPLNKIIKKTDARWLDANPRSLSFALLAKEFGFDIEVCSVDKKINHELIAAGINPSEEIFSNFSDASFDVISFNESLQDHAYPGEALQQAFRILSIDGNLILSFSNSECPSWRYAGELERKKYLNTASNINIFSLKSLTSLLDISKFEILEIHKESSIYAGITLICKKMAA